MILGAATKYQELQDFRNGTTSSNFNIVNFNNGGEDAIESIDSIVKNQQIDSIIDDVNLEEKLTGLDSIQKANVLSAVNSVKDSHRE